ncbi:MAG: ferritin-like domain-containing protein [Chloroflexota bacterium]|nr:ferritin-like domain-containing protein [Chloroflexota bacterium]
MRPLSELFAEAANRPGTSLPTRRGMLALAGAAASVPVIVGVESVFAQSAQHSGKKAKDKREDRREKKRDRNNRRDIAVLNYALTLEHLEFKFYRRGLARFDSTDFAGYDSDVRPNLVDIRDHELEHVEALTATIRDLGGKPVKAADCYNFEDAFEDVDAFVETAQALEDTGVSAYTGALAKISSADLQTVGATIATVEARHAAYLRDVNGNDPFPRAFDTPLSKGEVLDIAAPFFDCE